MSQGNRKIKSTAIKKFQFSLFSGNDLQEKHKHSSLSFKTIKLDYFHINTIEYIFYVFLNTFFPLEAVFCNKV